MIRYRREPLAPPLKALAWREPDDPETGRRSLVVVVSDALSAKESRGAAMAAIRKLPKHHRPPLRSAASGIWLAALAAVPYGKAKLIALATAGAIATTTAGVGVVTVATPLNPLGPLVPAHFKGGSAVASASYTPTPAPPVGRPRTLPTSWPVAPSSTASPSPSPTQAKRRRQRPAPSPAPSPVTVPLPVATPVPAPTLTPAPPEESAPAETPAPTVEPSPTDSPPPEAQDPPAVVPPVTT